MSDSGEKDQPATQRKLRKARERGEVASSADFVSAIVFTCASLAVLSGVPLAVQLVSNIFERSLLVVEGRSEFLPVQSIENLAFGLLNILAKPMLVILGAAILINLIIKQGLPVSLQSISPKFSKLNPLAGFKNIFSKTSLVSIFMALLKFSAWTASAYLIIWYALPSILASGACGAACTLEVARQILVAMFIAALVIIIIGGAADLPLQIMMFMKRQRMTKEEIKKEYEDQEGKPEIRMHRRQIAQEIANAPPLPKEGLAAGSLVLTDGSKAIVVMFRQGQDQVPVVIARGDGQKGADIRLRGASLGLLVETDIELARKMFKKHQPGDPIQQEFYQPIALLLVKAPRK